MKDVPTWAIVVIILGTLFLLLPVIAHTYFFIQYYFEINN